MDRLAYHDFAFDFDTRSWYYEAMGLGPASSYSGSAAQNLSMIKWMRENGFRRGTLSAKKNQWAMTQEDGLEIINKPGLGMFTPIGRGDTVFTADQTKALWDISQSYVDRFAAKVPAAGGVTNATINNSVVVEIERVQDYNDFVTQLQRDEKFSKLIRACSVDMLNGKNPVAKRRINF